MGNVLALVTSEVSAIDTDAIQALKRSVGEKRCRTVLDGMIYGITDGLCQVERAVQAKTYDALPESLPQLRVLSGQVGLVCMADVLGDLEQCVEDGDEVAIHAVTARLIRIGEDSLFNLIEFADRSIV